MFQRDYSRRFHAIARIAKRKLDQLHAATSIEDLAAIPGNRLEALAGDRKGQHAIRVNAQWRLCFEWRRPDAYLTEIVDYH